MEYRENPLLVIGAAFFGAMALGLLVHRSHDEAPREVFDDDESFETRAGDAGATTPSRSSHFFETTERAKRQAGETWEHILDALLGVAAARAIDVVAGMVPGFGDEYSRRHPEHERSAFGRG